MEPSLRLWLLVLASTGCGTALLDLTGVQEIEGTWKASVRLPCVYEPSADFTQETVLWKTSLSGDGIRTIFRRDPNSGDQTLLTHFKNRIRIPKDPPGDVSLLIEDLDMSDRGQYTCEVVWVARNKNRMRKERMTVLRVIKVAVTKPVITAGSPGSILPRGRNTSLTCHTNGSPPITYQWLKAAQRGNEDRVGQDAVLHFDSLQVSDTGTYFCEVGNRVSSAVQRSNAFQLTVKDPSEFPTSNRPSSGNAETTTAERTPQTASLPFDVIVPIAVLSAAAAVLLAILVVVFHRRKSRPDHTYGVTYNNPVSLAREEGRLAVTRMSRCESEQVTPRVENNYTTEPTQSSEYVHMDTKSDSDYEKLVHKMESEYEVVDTQWGAGVATWRPSQ
ncbi:PREDICTED: V-set and immunoglobulin domain-containing protein 4 isoform X2 [Gekko japonicus]|uniref:V-set and immunoglobulin domain-containing protein 4 isoform X2 n=1 Tax=Gekko japonicus TaxID=146911 RepID=UPI00074FC5CB|nr:PREDICTED: V-set and immunoglobulin domain-containing protein 4 isoform X2 [Gekko japonicus]